MRKDKEGYEENIHYNITLYYFVRSRLPNEQKQTIKKSLYLTYQGLIRVLFVSKNKHVNRFQEWAFEKLFAMQMGSKEEKIKLGTDILKFRKRGYKRYRL